MYKLVCRNNIITPVRAVNQGIKQHVEYVDLNLQERKSYFDSSSPEIIHHLKNLNIGFIFNFNTDPLLVELYEHNWKKSRFDLCNQIYSMLPEEYRFWFLETNQINQEIINGNPSIKMLRWMISNNQVAYMTYFLTHWIPNEKTIMLIGDLPKNKTYQILMKSYTLQKKEKYVFAAYSANSLTFITTWFLTGEINFL